MYTLNMIVLFIGINLGLCLTYLLFIMQLHLYIVNLIEINVEIKKIAMFIILLISITSMYIFKFCVFNLYYNLPQTY